MLASPSPSPRAGIVVAKHRHSSVERNRLKRRLRELVRLRLLPALASMPPVDIVVRSRPQAYDASFSELGEEVDLVRRTIVDQPSDV